MTPSDNDPVRFAMRASSFLAPVCVVACTILAGPKGGGGALIGAVTSIGSLWIGSRIVRRTIHEQAMKIPAQGRLQIALLLKLPLFAMIVYAVSRLGLGAAASFVSGYLLVYCALLVGAVYRPRSL